MLVEGLEPTCLAAEDFESSASAISPYQRPVCGFRLGFPRLNLLISSVVTLCGGVIFYPRRLHTTEQARHALSVYRLNHTEIGAGGGT